MTSAAEAGSDGVQRIGDLLIPMRDGVALAGDLYLPPGPGPFPILVSAYPYHKDDIAGAFNECWRLRFAAEGYGTLLVDSRGSGASSGVPAAAASAPSEGEDGHDTIEWAARQSWSGGPIGVWGMSYGGANALAAAAQRPPHLGAVICIYGYADSYLDGVVPGGWPACLGRFAREAFMLALALAPPARRDGEGRWRGVWEQRLAETDRRGPVSLAWPSHPDRDGYWAALHTDVSRIEVPTFLIAGWRDLYPSALARVFQALPAPKRLLAGPWLHVSPELAAREQVEWLDEAVGWWRDWLGDGPGAGPRSAPVTCFMEGAGWRAFEDWPPPECETTTLNLRGDGALDAAGVAVAATAYDADATVGAMAGLLDPLGVGVGYPLDQGLDEAASLTFTSEPLEAPLELAGAPTLLASVEVVRGGGPMMLSAKLSDVSPRGSSTLICRGWANVWHPHGHETSLAPGAGERRELRVELGAIAHRVAAGHRLRLSIACADFPTMWPSDGGEQIRLHHGGEHGSRLLLPAHRGESRPPSRALPAPAAGIDRSPWDAGGEPEWTITRDLVDGSVAVALGGHSSLRLPGGVAFELDHRARAVAGPGRPAELETTARIEIAYPDGATVSVDTSGHHRRTSMRYEGGVVADGETVFSGSWAAEPEPPPSHP